MRFEFSRGDSGHSSLTVFLVILVMSTLLLSSLTPLREKMRESQEARQEWERRVLKEQIIKKIMTELEADPTPLSHSPSDPVWLFLDSFQDKKVDVELKDMSSRLNPNFMKTELLKKTSLEILIINGSSPESIRYKVLTNGFCTNLNVWKDTFGEENLNRFFTLYSWANINVSNEDSLESLFRFRAGSAGAAAFRSRLQEGLKEAKLWKEEELKTILGFSGNKLYPAINSLPLMNVHYIDPLLLNALLAYPYGEAPLENPQGMTDQILRRRQDSEITPAELSTLLNPQENQFRVLEYLGTRTWFWELTVNIDGWEYTSLIASYGEGWFKVK